MRAIFDINYTTTIQLGFRSGKGLFTSDPTNQVSGDFVGFWSDNCRLTMSKKDEARLNEIDNMNDLRDFVAEIKCDARVGGFSQ